MAIERKKQERLRTPAGLRTNVMTLAGEQWLVLSFPLPVSTPPDHLTASERAVVGLVLRGLSNADIARERGTSINTIGNQIATVFKKLGVHSRLDLVRSVERRSIVESQ